VKIKKGKIKLLKVFFSIIHRQKSCSEFLGEKRKTLLYDGKNRAPSATEPEITGQKLNFEKFVKLKIKSLDKISNFG